MLIKISAIALLAVCAAQWIYIQRLRRQLRRQRKEIEAWKLACANYERDAKSW